MVEARRNISAAIVSLCLAVVACSRKPAAENGASRVDSTTAPKVAPEPAAASAELRGTDWELVALGDRSVTAADSSRTAHIVLHRDSKQVSGSGGCNRMFGVYELNGDALRFSGVGSTKMACKDGMDTEGAFLSALLRVARWRITGRQLELSDSTGVVLAKFEARSSK